MRGLFVTGTGTGVGKSVLSACLLASMRAAEEPVRAYKPVLTGVEEPAAQSLGWPEDHELLGESADMAPEHVAPLRFGPAVSPHLAAQLANTQIDPDAILAHARAHDPKTILIVEGVGGLLVPLRGAYTVLDLAVDLGLDLLLAATTELGTINHTLLTLQAARSRGLRVRAVVMGPWPERAGKIECSNRTTVAQLGEIDVHTLPLLDGPHPAALSAAGDALPWREWLQEPKRGIEHSAAASAPHAPAPQDGALALAAASIAPHTRERSASSMT